MATISWGRAMQTSSIIAFSLQDSPIGACLFKPPQSALCAANDNGGGKSTDPSIVEASLRHFAEYGLGAARAARYKAEQAFFAGDQSGFRLWQEICRQLDRRLAESNERDLGI